MAGAGLTLAISQPTGAELGGVWRGRPLYRMSGLTDIAVTPDDRRAVLTSALGQSVVDLETGERIWQRPDRPGVAVVLSGDGVVSVTTRYDGCADVDRVADGVRLAQLEGDGSSTLPIAAVSSDGRVVALTGGDGAVRVHVVRPAAAALPVRFPSGAHAAAVSNDGRLLALGDDAGRVYLLDRGTGAVLAERDGYAPGVRHLRFSQDDRTLLLGLRAGEVGVLDLVTGRLDRHAVGGRAPALDWLPDGNVGVVTTLGDALRLDPRTGARVPLGRVMGGSNWDGVTIPGTSRMVVDGHDPRGPWEAVVVDMADGRVVTRRAISGSGYRVAVSPDGRTVASGTQEGKLELWDPVTGALVRAVRADAGPTLGVAWSPDGTRVATTGFDGQVLVWDAATGGLLRRFRAHDGPGTAVAFTPDGAAVLSTGGQGAVLLPLDAHTRHAAAVQALSGPPAGRAAALAVLGWWERVEPALDDAVAKGAPDDPALRARARLATGGVVREVLTGEGCGVWEVLVGGR